MDVFHTISDPAVDAIPSTPLDNQFLVFISQALQS
jgi:hypothetical protein